MTAPIRTMPEKPKMIEFKFADQSVYTMELTPEFMRFWAAHPGPYPIAGRVVEDA